MYITFLVDVSKCLLKAIQGDRVCFGAAFQMTLHHHGGEGMELRLALAMVLEFRHVVTPHLQSEIGEMNAGS